MKCLYVKGSGREYGEWKDRMRARNERVLNDEQEKEGKLRELNVVKMKQREYRVHRARET